jgi:hypothetical protein
VQNAGSIPPNVKREAVCLFHKKERAVEEEHIVKREMARLCDYFVSEMNVLKQCKQSIFSYFDGARSESDHSHEYLTGCLTLVHRRLIALELQFHRTVVLLRDHIVTPEYDAESFSSSSVFHCEQQTEELVEQLDSFSDTEDEDTDFDHDLGVVHV